MKVLAIGRPRPGVDAGAEIAKHAREELAALWALYRSGVVREMYSPGGPGAILILEADNAEAAQSALADLPLVAHAIISFEVIELGPFAAIEMLFSSDDRR